VPSPVEDRRYDAEFIYSHRGVSGKGLGVEVQNVAWQGTVSRAHPENSPVTARWSPAHPENSPAECGTTSKRAAAQAGRTQGPHSVQKHSWAVQVWITSIAQAPVMRCVPRFDRRVSGETASHRSALRPRRALQYSLGLSCLGVTCSERRKQRGAGSPPSHTPVRPPTAFSGSTI
jgi:hypothetical protein